MDITIFPSPISGTLRAPASKSQAIRLIAAAMLAKGKSHIRYPSDCDDALAMRRIAERLGARVTEAAQVWEIRGGIGFGIDKINCGESGLAARLMIALASVGNKRINVTGEGTLMKRHLGDIQNTMESAGVTCHSNSGRLPFTVHGPLNGGRYEVDGSGGSQFVSGLLMALPLAAEDSELVVHNLKSIPYVYMTLEALERSGIEIQHNDYQVFQIRGNQKYRSFEAEVEGDWSGAAFPLVAGAVAGEISLEGLNMQSSQADSIIPEALKSAGATISHDQELISISKSPLKAFEFDATHCPDLFPPLAVLAAASQGISRITGVDRLAQKESNRGIVLRNELGKLGIRIQLEGNVMTIHGGEVIGGEIFSHNDHRIAMAGAVAGLTATGPVIIRHADCVSKSWPGFFKDMSKLGAVVKHV